MRLPRLVAGALAAGLLALASPAVAADDTSIGYVEPTQDGLQVVVSVPTGAAVDLSGVTMTVEGAEVPTSARPAQGQDIDRTSILVFDTSNSMRGERFEAAKAAATAYLDAVPGDVEVGIVTFDSEVTRALAPTTDRASAKAVMEQLTLRQRTRLYDGILNATAMAGTQGQRSLLVLSDGADTSSIPLTDVTDAIDEAGVFVDVVSLDDAGDLDSLTQLSAAGSGEVITAGTEALAEIFADEARVLASQLLVTGQVPEGTEPEGTIAVSLTTTDGQTLTAEAYAPIRRPQDIPEGPISIDSGARGIDAGDWFLWISVGVLSVGLLIFLVVLMFGFSNQTELTAEERVALYTTGGAPASALAAKDGAGSEQAFSQFRGAAEAVLSRNTSLEERIAAKLDAAGMDWRTSEWLLLHVGVVVASGILGLLLGGGNLILGILFIGFGAAGPWMFLKMKRKRRVKKFNALLPDTLQLMSGSLAAGLSLAQSVDTIVREGSEPISSEFKRVLVETRLGVSLEDALSGITDRFDSKDFAWVVMAIKIQRQVGGNLAELLDNVAATIREREYMRRQVNALAAEGKMSAYVLGGLPPGFLVYLLMTRPSYVMVMFTDPLGWLMLGGAVVLLAAGAFWMSRLIKVEV